MGLKVCLIVMCLLVTNSGNARPTDKVKTSGEPTHFQVDDKAAELEINANAMGVKVNAKPASLQVVSKPGAPAIPIPHPVVVQPPLVPVPQPAVFAPRYPGYYYGAPFYPSMMGSPMAVAHRRTVRHRHHFYDMKPSVGNWNFKKEKIPGKLSRSAKVSDKIKHSNKISKKSEISEKVRTTKKTGEHVRKREWIQRIPVLAQMAPVAFANIRVHPLVQQMIASQAAIRASVSRPSYNLGQLPFSPPRQQLSFVSLSSPMELGPSYDLRSQIHRALFLPALPGYQTMQTLSPLTPNLPQQWLNPSILQAQVSGYYDPVLTRDFIPDFNTPALPRVQAASPKGLIPTRTISGYMFPTGYTPLGQVQILSKRLIIPHKKQEQSIADKTRNKRSDTQTGKGKVHKSNKTVKRQFILSQPVAQSQAVVAYLPLVTSHQSEDQMTSPAIKSTVLPSPAATISPGMISPFEGSLLMNLPGRPPGTFVVNVPLNQQMFPSIPKLFLNQHHHSYIVVPAYQPNFVSTATQRSRVVQQLQDVHDGSARFLQGLPQRHFQQDGVPQGTTRNPLGELAGIIGTPIIRHGPYVTLFYKDQVPFQVQDEIFRDIPLQGRTNIPRRQLLPKFKYFQSNFQKDSSDYSTDSYDDLSSSARIQDEGSYSERVLPDGKTVFRKDHVGFGPITVEAKTADSVQKDDVDMNLDSDKRKEIPKPGNEQNIVDRRLEIPTPKEQK